MATINTGRMTAEVFQIWSDREEYRERRFELGRGEVVEMPSPGKSHGFVCGNVARHLGNYAALTQKGYVCTNDSGMIVERDPDTVFGPDIACYDDALTLDGMDRGFSEYPPRLVVEVLSPSDRMGRMTRRVNEFFKFGVRAVWVVDPESENVVVRLPYAQPIVLEENELLTGGEALPDFQCRVAELFQLPGRASK